MEATQFGKDATAETNLSQPGRTDEHVAAELGMSMTQWKKLKTVFDRAKSGDEEAQEMLKAVATGRPFPLADYLGKLGVL